MHYNYVLRRVNTLNATPNWAISAKARTNITYTRQITGCLFTSTPVTSLLSVVPTYTDDSFNSSNAVDSSVEKCVKECQDLNYGIQRVDLAEKDL